MIYPRVSLVALVILQTLACGAQSTDTETPLTYTGAPSKPNPESFGTLHAQLAPTGTTNTIGGLLWSAVCEDGTLTTEWVPLLPPTTDLPGMDPDQTQTVADWFSVLPTGECTVTVVATGDDQTVFSECSPVTLTVVVTANITTELVVNIPCGIIPTGGIDIVGVINTPPDIITATLSPKVAQACQPIVVTVTAVDPDGDPLSFVWIPLQEDPPITLETTGPETTVISPGPGPIPLRLVVSDPHGGTTGVDMMVPWTGPAMVSCP